MSFGTMRDRIAFDLNRADLTSSIALHIKSAIKHYESKSYFYNEQHSTATVTSQEYVSLPTGYKSFRAIRCSIGGNDDYKLDPKNHDWFEKVSRSGVVGNPIYYNVTDSQLRLYPRPDQTATLTMSFNQELSAVSASGDTNAWFNQGEILIRTKATAYTLRFTMHDNERAIVFDDQAASEELGLDRRNTNHGTEAIESWL